MDGDTNHQENVEGGRDLRKRIEFSSGCVEFKVSV